MLMALERLKSKRQTGLHRPKLLDARNSLLTFHVGKTKATCDKLFLSILAECHKHRSRFAESHGVT